MSETHARNGEVELSVVIPVYNEVESVNELAEELVSVLDSAGCTYEIIFVDDASRDGSSLAIKELMRSNPNIRGVRLLFNSRKSGALETGFSLATGKIVVTMDADLQDDPKEIIGFIEEIRSGADVVNGWKKNRKDSFQKRTMSMLMNTISALLLGNFFQDMNSGFKAYRGSIAKALVLPGGLYRFIPHILVAQGYEVREIPVHHRERKYGRTKFGFLHRLKGVADLFTVFVLYRLGSVSSMILTFCGILFFVIGSVLLSYLVYTWFAFDHPRIRPMLLAGIFSVLLGVQLVILRFLFDAHRGKLGERNTPAYENL